MLAGGRPLAGVGRRLHLALSRRRWCLASFQRRWRSALPKHCWRLVLVRCRHFAALTLALVLILVCWLVNPAEAETTGLSGASAALTAGSTSANGAQASGLNRATASVAPLITEVGRPIALRLEVSSADADYRPLAPDALAIPEWEVLDGSRRELPPQGGERRWVYEFKIVSWQEGMRTIPSVDLGALTTSALQVEVKPTDLGTLQVSAHPCARPGLGRLRGTSLAGCAGCVLALVLFGLWRRFWRNSRRDFWRPLVRRLEGLSLDDEGAMAILENVAREYLSDKLQLRAPGLTLEELAAALNSRGASCFSEARRAQWREFLLALARDKYAPMSPESAAVNPLRLKSWIEEDR